MSYEGAEMFLCISGHLSMGGSDYYDYYEPKAWVCPHCSGEMAWSAMIDTTNNDGVWPVLSIFEEERVDTCEHCGRSAVIEPTKYYIPLNRRPISERVKQQAKVPFTNVQFSIGYKGKRVFDTEREAHDYLEEKEDARPDGSSSMEEWDEYNTKYSD